MNKRAIFAIIRKDLKVVSQNKGVMLPIIMLPLILFVVLPWLFALIPSMVSVAGVSANDLEELQELINRMPAGFQQEMAVYADNQGRCASVAFTRPRSRTNGSRRFVRNTAWGVVLDEGAANATRHHEHGVP